MKRFQFSTYSEGDYDYHVMAENKDAARKFLGDFLLEQDKKVFNSSVLENFEQWRNMTGRIKLRDKLMQDEAITEYEEGQVSQ